MKCLKCEKELQGKQTKYCCVKCRLRATNHSLQSYECQKKRATKRKLELIRMKGGKCSKCGYCKNHSALEFHHTNPLTKEYNLDSRKLSNSKWENILKELEKCELVCANCHREIHFSDCEMVGPEGFEPTCQRL